MKIIMKVNNDRQNSSLIFLTVICLSLFLVTIEIRKDWFGKLAENSHQWLTASTVKFTRNWYRDGIFADRFLMLEKPRSIEFQNLKDRKPYLSYPIGAIVPIYLLALISGQEPSVELVMTWNLANHFLTALILSFIVFFLGLSLKIGRNLVLVLAIVVMILSYFLPSNLYWFQNVYFADQAIILPFVLMILLQVIKFDIRAKNKDLEFWEKLVIFWGLFTEPSLFIFVTLIYYFINYGRKWLVKWKLWIPIMSLAIYYIFSIWITNGKNEFWDKVRLRSGLSNSSQVNIVSFLQKFWLDKFSFNYSSLMMYLLWGASIGLIILWFFELKKGFGNKMRKLLNISILCLLPCLLQVHIFSNHSIVHRFSVFKFFVPILLIFFGALPICLILKSRKNIILNYFLVLGLFVLGLFYVKKLPSIFVDPDQKIKMIGKFIDKNTDYEDIVFSSEIEIEENPPEYLAYSMKLVYLSFDIDDIYEVVEKIDGEYVINLLDLDKHLTSFYLRDLSQLAYKQVKNEEVKIFKINKNKFLSYYREVKSQSE
jgi:hypothetical protein